jgi:acyl-CoA synthetase (AMP-forming)/AMP-acid ligase II
MDIRIRTIAQILDCHYESAPGDTAITFLKNGGELEVSLNYAELRRRCLALAADFSSRVSAGDRVLLIFSSGVDFAVAFFAVQYVGAIAVPLAAPRRDFDRLRRVVADCDPALIVASTRIIEKLPADLLRQCRTCACEDFPMPSDEPGFVNRTTYESDVAVLQYTSGSVGVPKGVVLTHRNIIANEWYIARRFEHSPGFVGLSWLPVFHDMGLFGGLLQPLFMRGTAILMSPFSFLQRPARWLKAISDFGVQSSGAPNFAYEHCINRIDLEDLDADLSTWSVAFVGAEPVRARTLDRFAEKFGPLGFRKEALYPCYGLAEATLLVTSNDRSAVPPRASRGALGAMIVSSGRVDEFAPIVIADPYSEELVDSGGEGEICVSGASISKCYWRSQDHRTLTLNTCAGQVNYLRTKDVGFIRDGQVYVVGRLDDVIVSEGRKFHPLDLEDLIAEFDALRLSRAAAFGVSDEQNSYVVMMIEASKRSAGSAVDWFDVMFRVRTLAAERLGLMLSSVQIVGDDSLPRTTSGKIRRSACRDLFVQGGFPTLATWETSEVRSLLRDRSLAS